MLISVRPSCAQRLSASRIISAARASRVANVARPCSTPFGITDYFGLQRLLLGLEILLVLNAFRHHGLFRSPTTLAESLRTCAQRLSASRIISVPEHGQHLLSLLGCSTPFGITDYFGRSAGRTPPTGWSGAQRLSASRIISVAGLGPGECALISCSTPFGITDYFGLLRAPPHELLWKRAQRLSASRIISDLPCHPPPPGDTCAQRLSASRIISGSARTPRPT